MDQELLKKQAFEDLRQIIAGKKPINGTFINLGNQPTHAIYWYKNEGDYVITIYWQDLPAPFIP